MRSVNLRLRKSFGHERHRIMRRDWMREIETGEQRPNGFRRGLGRGGQLPDAGDVLLDNFCQRAPELLPFLGIKEEVRRGLVVAR